MLLHDFFASLSFLFRRIPHDADCWTRWKRPSESVVQQLLGAPARFIFSWTCLCAAFSSLPCTVSSASKHLSSRSSAGLRESFILALSPCCVPLYCLPISIHFVSNPAIKFYSTAHASPSMEFLFQLVHIDTLALWESRQREGQRKNTRCENQTQVDR